VKLIPRRDEIHLWFVFCGEITDASLLASYRRLLSPAEAAQELRFRMAASRHRYLLTRALVRTTLSRYAPPAPAQWAIATDRYGRPRILNQDAGVADISFNISHTEDLILLGITARSALGVDVETLRERTPSLQLADRFFSRAESHCLRELAPAARQSRFFDFWTLKESYIKARGQGLSIPLDRFGFHIRDRELSLRVHPELGDSAGRWRFWLLEPCAGHVAAVCAERPESGDQSLITRAVVPLRAQRTLDCSERGRSA
jgi:4'-phosphopantetheinyl transferase